MSEHISKNKLRFLLFRIPWYLDSLRFLGPSKFRKSRLPPATRWRLKSAEWHGGGSRADRAGSCAAEWVPEVWEIAAHFSNNRSLRDITAPPRWQVAVCKPCCERGGESVGKWWSCLGRTLPLTRWSCSSTCLESWSCTPASLSALSALSKWHLVSAECQTIFCQCCQCSHLCPSIQMILQMHTSLSRGSYCTFAWLPCHQVVVTLAIAVFFSYLGLLGLFGLTKHLGHPGQPCHLGHLGHGHLSLLFQPRRLAHAGQLVVSGRDVSQSYRGCTSLAFVLFSCSHPGLGHLAKYLDISKIWLWHNFLCFGLQQNVEIAPMSTCLNVIASDSLKLLDCYKMKNKMIFFWRCETSIHITFKYQHYRHFAEISLLLTYFLKYSFRKWLWFVHSICLQSGNILNGCGLSALFCHNARNQCGVDASSCGF